ncbi:MAG: hypothetical protein D8M57_19665 [Candidatus Scalindua sp. AMX11]|nr:MAG: hypothetical protein D8M57_19665 [Candidatus Scalindua sp. AMX11]
METGYGCNTVTLTDERVRNGEHKLQPVATAPALYSTLALARGASSGGLNKYQIANVLVVDLNALFWCLYFLKPLLFH